MFLLMFLPLIAGSTQAQSGVWPTAHFNIVGAVFDDGGGVVGGFDFNFDASKRMPLPQFHNVQISTTAGSVLPGSNFTTTGVCFHSDKKERVCAPGDDLLLYVETGTYGEPGYTRFQIATFFAPQAEWNQNGLLDPIYSYEMGCTDAGCLVRHIIAGAIR
jgi:hypothetical protein